jgi:hypothetical protein
MDDGIGDTDEAGDVASKIQQGVKFDPLVRRNAAQGNNDKQRSTMVASRA